jgi:hypothetical protein
MDQRGHSTFSIRIHVGNLVLVLPTGILQNPSDGLVDDFILSNHAALKWFVNHRTSLWSIELRRKEAVKRKRLTLLCLPWPLDEVWKNFHHFFRFSCVSQHVDEPHAERMLVVLNVSVIVCHMKISKSKIACRVAVHAWASPDVAMISKWTSIDYG